MLWQVIVEVVLVSSPAVAEATKIVENVYRSVNIALVNELKMVFDKMDIDVWEVINAAKTKPFGFNAFYPSKIFQASEHQQFAYVLHQYIIFCLRRCWVRHTSLVSPPQFPYESESLGKLPDFALNRLRTLSILLSNLQRSFLWLLLSKPVSLLREYIKEQQTVLNDIRL